MSQTHPIDKDIGQASRHAAYELLEITLRKKQMLDQAVLMSSHYKALSGADRRLAMMIAALVLRRSGEVEFILKDLVDPALQNKRTGDLKLDPPALLHVLQLGVVQVIWMDVPDHAALNETVELCKSLGFRRQSGLVNALLRRLQKEKQDWLLRLKEQPAQSARLNFPQWLQDSWDAQYGAAQSDLMMLGLSQQAPIDITPRASKEAGFLADTIGGVCLPNGSIRLSKTRGTSPDITALPGYQEGAWWVQDIAASLPVRLFGDDLSGLHILDLCAAPGGKTLQLLARGARVTAVDRSAKRMEKLRENVKRCFPRALSDVALKVEAGQLQIEVAEAQDWAAQYAKRIETGSAEVFDGILMDVPCSATGTIRRHPELRFLKTEQDVAKLAALQAGLLDHMAPLLKSRGVLVYATCSLEAQECEAQMQAFRMRNQDLEAFPIKASDVSGLSQLVTSDGELRCLPHFLSAEGGMDGFFASRFIRR